MYKLIENAFSLQGLSIGGRVPGGIFTDLDRAGVLKDGPLLYRFNDVNYRWIAMEDWVYTLNFQGNKLLSLMHLAEQTRDYFFVRNALVCTKIIDYSRRNDCWPAGRFPGFSRRRHCRRPDPLERSFYWFNRQHVYTISLQCCQSIEGRYLSTNKNKKYPGIIIIIALSPFFYFRVGILIPDRRPWEMFCETNARLCCCT